MTRTLAAVMLFAVSASAIAADPLARSPYDTNPKCLERTTDASDPQCTLQTEGEPRQTHPPRKRPTAFPPPPPALDSAPRAPKASARDSGRPGGGAAR